MLALERSGAAAALEKAYRVKAQADRLRAALPGAVFTPLDARAFAVWWAAEERYWACHKQALEVALGAELADDEEGRRAIARGSLDPIGERVKAFADFCDQEMAPLLARLEKGLGLLEASEPGAPETGKLLRLYDTLRDRVRVLLPDAWLLIGAAAHLYSLLPPAMREEADRAWGPLTGTDPADFSPVWHRHFPTGRLRVVDARRAALTIDTTEEDA